MVGASYCKVQFGFSIFPSCREECNKGPAPFIPSQEGGGNTTMETIPGIPPPSNHTQHCKKQQKLFYCRAAILKKTAANGIVIISAIKASLVET
jgi:hypothetical protein